MLACCSKCHGLFETTQEEAYTPGVLCAPCYNFGECLRLAIAHVDAGAGPDAPSMAELRSRVRLWLRSRDVPADDDTVTAEAEKFLLVTYAW